MKFYMVTCALAAASSGVLFTFFAPYARSMGISILLVGVITFVFGFGRFLFYVLTVNQRVRYMSSPFRQESPKHVLGSRDDIRFESPDLS